MCGVVPAIAALDAEPRFIARTVAALGVQDLVVVNVIGQRATDAAIGANAGDSRSLRAWQQGKGQWLVRQGAGRTGGRTFAAGHAGARAHWLVEVEGDACAVGTVG